MDCAEDTDKNCLDQKENSQEENTCKKNDCVMECSDDVDSVKESSPKPQESEERTKIRKSMLDHLSMNDKVFFKSLKEGEDDLSVDQKIEMAEELLDRNYGLFLAKFGIHLLKEHLCYFENRSEEDSLIVDLHLNQLRRAFQQKRECKPSSKEHHKSNLAEEMEVAVEMSPAEQTRLNLRKRLLDHLSSSKEAHFKSQQVGEADLDHREKREIAEEVLDRSFSLFLTKFGTHLLEEHLDYFEQKSNEKSYEVEYLLKRLRKTQCKMVSQVEIKNRRYEALKKLLEEGLYFSETEMRNRNPLLYEELVGKFLTAEERKERINNIDTTNITLVNLLLEKMDREAVKKLKKEQEDAEDNVMEEEDTSDEEMENDYDSEEDNNLDKSMWGEHYTDSTPSISKPSTRKSEKQTKENRNKERESEDVLELEDSEKFLLLEEFRSNMFSSFLQGKDADFDYSKVDYNPDYDDLEAQGCDEEERYFDEESSQDASSHKMSDDEDLLDQFMSRLEPEPTPQQLADKLNTLTHEDT